MRAVFTHLVGLHKDKRESFDADRITIGRSPDNQLSFGDSQRRVSSHHAELVRCDDQYLLRDLGSTNGTMINGRRIVVSELNHDDMVEFGAGGPLLRFAIENEASHETILPPPRQRPSASASDSDFSRRITTRQGPTPQARNNSVLIGAMLAAMLLGAVGGIIFSRVTTKRDNGEMRFAEIDAASRPAVVLIIAQVETTNQSGEVISSEPMTGSGFLISNDGLIVTSRHLVRNWEYNPPSTGNTARTSRLDVVLQGHGVGDAIPPEVYRLSQSKDSDVAVLRIGATSTPSVRLPEPESGNIGQGEAVAVMGFPLGLDLLSITNDSIIDPTLSPGIVSRVGHDY